MQSQRSLRSAMGRSKLVALSDRPLPEPIPTPVN